MKYYVVAGEASGDLHASNLIKAIREKDPAAQFRGCGGDLMQQAGAELLIHYRDMAFMGFWEVFVHLKEVFGNMKRCKADILDWHPDVLVLVDLPGFNLRIAKFAKEHRIKVVYYISPQIWAWKKGRIKQIKRDVDEMMVILPFEKDFYAKHGMDVHYVGHPLLDAVSRDLPEREDVRNFKANHHLEDREIIALLPGSRKQEINAILPQMLKMTELFVILIHSVNDEFEAQGKRPIITLSKEDELAAKEPYLFLSVFHNLIANAVEASDNRRCVITISEQNGGDHYLYTVQDNGPGVPEEFRDKVFEPRFSTKFNEETGMVNRGLGLSLVKDIVEESLHGTIRLRQGSGGAAFEIRIPKDAMEVVE